MRTDYPQHQLVVSFSRWMNIYKDVNVFQLVYQSWVKQVPTIETMVYETWSSKIIIDIKVAFEQKLCGQSIAKVFFKLQAVYVQYQNVRKS